MSRRWGLEEIPGGVRTERKQPLIKAIAFGAEGFASSKRALRGKARGKVLGELCGVQAKNLEEEQL